MCIWRGSNSRPFELWLTFTNPASAPSLFWYHFHQMLYLNSKKLIFYPSSSKRDPNHSSMHLPAVGASEALAGVAVVHECLCTSFEAEKMEWICEFECNQMHHLEWNNFRTNCRSSIAFRRIWSASDWAKMKEYSTIPPRADTKCDFLNNWRNHFCCIS